MKKFLSAVGLILTIDCSPIIYTPKGIAVKTNGYIPNLYRIDEKYQRVEQCLNTKADKESLLITIVTDDNKFQCEKSPTSYCNGFYLPQFKTILITENLAALAHELAHFMGIKGHPEIVQKCGIRIDNEYDY